MSNLLKLKQKHRAARVARVRAKILGTAARPRFAVFRSLKHVGAQLIDDVAGKTLVSASDHELTKGKKSTKTEQAGMVGTLLAEKADKLGITNVVFDRRSYKYHGRIKSVADAARTAGLKF